MKVLLLCTDAYGGHGGIALYNRDLAEALAARDDVEEVIVVPRVIRRETGELPPVMGLQVLCIMDQHVRAPGKIHQPPVRSYIALRIRCIHHRVTAPCDAIGVDSAGMSIRFVNADDNGIVRQPISFAAVPFTKSRCLLEGLDGT